MKIQIKARITDATLFECEIADDTPPRYRTREALQKAVSAGANLARAHLTDAAFDIKPATREEAIANLDRAREIILDDPRRLRMDHWHAHESKWKEHTCAEEALCGTTHCLAGWLQVCSADEKIRNLVDPQLAGIICAPIASHMFFRKEREVTEWLKGRMYANVAERAK